MDQWSVHRHTLSHRRGHRDRRQLCGRRRAQAHPSHPTYTMSCAIQYHRTAQSRSQLHHCPENRCISSRRNEWTHKLVTVATAFGPTLNGAREHQRTRSLPRRQPPGVCGQSCKEMSLDDVDGPGRLARRARGCKGQGNGLGADETGTQAALFPRRSCFSSASSVSFFSTGGTPPDGLLRSSASFASFEARQSDTS